MPGLRVAFMGTPAFALPSLEALRGAGHVVAAVYTQPPRPAGRGQKLRLSPVHQYAEEHGLLARTPTSLRDPAVQSDFAALDLDIAVVAAYGLILPVPILTAPRLGAINVHASLLPRWRGAAPIARAIMAGDRETGITIMQMDEGLDTGAILLMRRLAIAPSMNAASLHDALAQLGGALLPEVLDGLAAGTLKGTPQPAQGVTYAHKLTPPDMRLDWSKTAAELERQVRGLAPHPGAWFEYNDQRIKVLAAEVRPGFGQPGQVLDDALTIACAHEALRLLVLQRPGKAPVPAPAFLRGFAIAGGCLLLN